MPYKKNQESTMKIFFLPYGKTPHSDSLSINNVSIPMVRGVARYETVFNNEAMKSLIVKGEFKTPYEQSVILQDTFKIYPNTKN